MGRRNVRAGNFAKHQGSHLRALRERAKKKAEAAKPAPPLKPNPYQRLMSKIDQDNKKKESDSQPEPPPDTGSAA